MEALLSFLLICLKQRQISSYYRFSIALVPRLDACEEMISFFGPQVSVSQGRPEWPIPTGEFRGQERPDWLIPTGKLFVKLVNVGKRKGAAKANIVHEISNDRKFNLWQTELEWNYLPLQVYCHQKKIITVLFSIFPIVYTLFNIQHKVFIVFYYIY